MLARRHMRRQGSGGASVRRSAAGVAGGIAIVVALTSQALAISIELKDVASDRIERQRAAAEGSLPLPGTPDLARLQERLIEKDLKLGSPILLRAFKSESEFEVWIRKDEAYVLFATYPVCHWSGTLGPKLQEGDKQTPEGFYTVTKQQIRHVGRWPRSLNLGFPNPYDKSLARTGSHILVHGGCSSVGCFAMTNSVIEEIYLITEQAIAGGQRFVPVHVYPFRLSEANLASQKDSPWIEFWTNLKEGYDLFDQTRRPPRITTCEGRYRFTDVALEEGADTGPLAVCGETFAALQTLAQLSPIALAQLSRQMNPSVPGPRSLSADRHLHSRHESRNVRAAGRPATSTGLLHPAMHKSTPPPCSMQRASCRHFVAVREHRLERTAAARRKARHAGR